MKRLLTTTVLTVILLATAAPGLAQTRRGRSAPPPPRPVLASPPAVQVPVDQGRFEGGVYSNDFFGVSFTTPQGWFTQDAEAKKRIIDSGMEVVGEGASARKKADMQAAMSRTYFLVSVSKYDPSSAPGTDFNALLMCVAERVPSAVIATEAEYIRMSLRALQGTSARATLTGPVRMVKVGGANFATADVKMTIGPVAAVQKYYVRLVKGHALALVYTYVDDADLKTFEEILKTVKFK